MSSVLWSGLLVVAAVGWVGQANGVPRRGGRTGWVVTLAGVGWRTELENGGVCAAV